MHKTFKDSILDTEKSVILWANWFQFASGERILHPRVSSRMLLWCQEGKGRVRVNGIWHAMKADDFLFLPWQHEVLYCADELEPFYVGGIHIIPDHSLNQKLIFSVSHTAKDEMAKCRWRRDLAWPGLTGVRVGKAMPLDPLRLLGNYIVERFEEGSIAEPSLRMLSHLLLHEIARAVTPGTIPRQGNDAVRRAQEMVECHLDRKISLSSLARFSDCSVSTLRRHFQQTLGMAPYEWILQTRLRRSRRLLTTTTLRIKEIAERVGFDDPFQFSRTFRQRTGCSPRQFRTKYSFAPKQ